VGGNYFSADMAKGGSRGDKAWEEKIKGVIKEGLSSRPRVFTKMEIKPWEAQNRS